MALTLDDLIDSVRDPERLEPGVVTDEIIIGVLVLLTPTLGTSIVAHEQNNQ